jgi:hypothetical protein
VLQRQFASDNNVDGVNIVTVLVSMFTDHNRSRPFAPVVVRGVIAEWSNPLR